MNYSKNQKYFEKISHKPTVIMAIIGVIFCMTCKVATFLIGLLLIAGAVTYEVIKKKGVISDEEFDEIAFEKLKGIKEKALNKLGVDEDEVKEIEPIIISSYSIHNITAAKLGKDDKWRTDRVSSMTLLFSANEVHCYTYDYSLFKDEERQKTDVYFYRDIVSVSTDSSTEKVEEKVNGKTGIERDITTEYFVLTTAGGTSLRCGIRDIDGAERSIKAMRQLLKEKKSSLQ